MSLLSPWAVESVPQILILLSSKAFTADVRNIELLLLESVGFYQWESQPVATLNKNTEETTSIIYDLVGGNLNVCLLLQYTFSIPIIQLTI